MALLPVTEHTPVWAQDLWPFVSQIVLTIGWSMFNVNLVPALTTATTIHDRHSAFALSSAVRGIGTFAGTMAGGMLPGLLASATGQTLHAPAPYRFALWVGAALGLAGALPLVFVRKSSNKTLREPITVARSFPVAPILFMAGYVYLRHAGWATCQAFFNAYLDSDLDLTASSIGLITGFGQILAIFASLITPRMAARRGHGWVLLVTTLGTAVSLLPLSLSASWVAASLGQIGILVLSAVWIPALQVFQMELVDERWRSIAYGAVSMAMGLGYGSTSLAGGYIISSWGYRRLFSVGIALSLAASAVLFVVLRVRGDGRGSETDSQIGS
jgi:predicted MFS family arabinose efflux permease